MKTILIQLFVMFAFGCSMQAQTQQSVQQAVDAIDSNIQKESTKNLTLDIPMIGLVHVKGASKELQEATRPLYAFDIDAELEMLSQFSISKEAMEKLLQASFLKED